MEAKQAPLIDLLERVPRDAVLVVEHDQFDSSSYPIGRLCHEAAAALRARASTHADNCWSWGKGHYECAVGQIERLQIDKAKFERAPCYLCGYNGRGYYQPDTHPCAAKYHAAQQARKENSN
ncbi:MAG: hypothetical protein INH13_02040, partial [Cupriavidus sp.]|nr:hypothetical protein [Cupriavidus sp.]